MGKRIKLEERTVTKTFFTPLKDKEVRELLEQAGGLSSDIRLDEEKLKAMVSEKKGEIQTKTNDLNDILEKLYVGKEEKEVTCTQVRDWSKKEIRWMDGKKVLEKRDMTLEECQVTLDVQAKKTGDEVLAGAEEKLKDDARVFKTKKNSQKGAVTLVQ